MRTLLTLIILMTTLSEYYSSSSHFTGALEGNFNPSEEVPFL
jgi:hypothetical protein